MKERDHFQLRHASVASYKEWFLSVRVSGRMILAQQFTAGMRSEKIAVSVTDG
jgi:hypothetical protein